MGLSCVATITKNGEDLLMETMSEGSEIEISYAATGTGNWPDNLKTKEYIRNYTDRYLDNSLMNQKNQYPISRFNVYLTLEQGSDYTVNHKQAVIEFLATNYDMTTQTELVDTDYRITEIGIFAKKKNTEDVPILFAIGVFASTPHSGFYDIMPAYDASLGAVQIKEIFYLKFPGGADVTVNVTGAAYLAEDGIALEGRMDAVEDRVTAVETDKVDMTTPLLNLDTQAAASTVDGQLTAALTALGWLNDVIES